MGYALFASVMLMIAGSFHFIAGLVGLDDEFYVVGQKRVFEFDTTTWTDPSLAGRPSSPAS